MLASMLKSAHGHFLFCFGSNLTTRIPKLNPPLYFYNPSTLALLDMFFYTRGITHTTDLINLSPCSTIAPFTSSQSYTSKWIIIVLTYELFIRVRHMAYQWPWQNAVTISTRYVGLTQTYMMFISRTVTLNGRAAMWTTASATCLASIVLSTTILPFGCKAPWEWLAAISVCAFPDRRHTKNQVPQALTSEKSLPMSIWVQVMENGLPSRAVDLVSPWIACFDAV